MRVYNVGNESVTIEKGTLAAQLEPVRAVLDPSIVEQPSHVRRSSVGEKQLPEHLQALYEESSSELTQEEQTDLFKLLSEYQDIFSKGSFDVGKTNVVQHDIKLTDQRPIKQHPRRMSDQKQQEADRQIDQLCDLGLVQPSNSAWASPIVMVKKKDGTLRMCIDYRALNEKTLKDAYPLPCIEEMFDTLSGNKWWATLDLASGYWQVENTEKAKELSAFCSRKGLFEWSVMPFGLCNAPATFERLMDRVLTGLQWQIALVYLDDIIVFGHTPSEIF